MNHLQHLSLSGTGLDTYFKLSGAGLDAYFKRVVVGWVSGHFWEKAPDSFGKYMPEWFGWYAHFLECKYRALLKSSNQVSARKRSFVALFCFYP